MKFSLFCLFVLSCVRANGKNSAAVKDQNIRDLVGTKRSLLFPDPLKSETKIQVLFGLGLPMEGEVSMTLGYVLKCNYRLPYNSSDSTLHPHVRQARANQPEVSAESLPLSNQIGRLSRWDLYRMLEMFMEHRGSSGRACLLRAVCESAEVSFRHERQTLLGQILHLFLTPSTTREEYEMYSDREYHAAEVTGRDSSGKACQMTYHECLYSPLNYITRIREL